MKERELKEKCYMEALDGSISNVKVVLNHMKKIDLQEGILEEAVLNKDRMRTILHLELALADYFILLRKMKENQFINYLPQMSKDINALIHCNRFEYHEQMIIVYSQRGEEDIDVERLISFGEEILESYGLNI